MDDEGSGQDAQRSCREKTAIAGSSLYYSLLFAPSVTQEAVCALQAWHLDLRAIAYDSNDIVVARRKLAWWVDEIERSNQGEPRHPTMRALLMALVGCEASISELAPATVAVAHLLERDGPSDETDLENFCKRSAGTVESLCARVLGAKNPGSLDCALELGTGLELAELTRPLPGERALPPRAIPGRTAGLPSPDAAVAREAVRRGIESRAHRAETLIRSAVDAWPREDRAACGVRICFAELTLAYLRSLQRAKFLEARRRIGIAPLHKLWIAWRVSRREQRNQDLSDS